VALSCFSTPLLTLTAARERGQLKRQKAMPVPPWTFVAAQIARAAAFAFGVGAIMLALGIAFYGVDLPPSAIPGFLIYMLLGTATLSALGIAATALAKNEESAQPIGAFTVMMLSFVSGVFIQVDTLPGFLQEIGRIFPLYHLAAGLQAAVAQSPPGFGISGGDVAALLVWGVVGIRVAAKNFRWEPLATAV
jgi:ABC-2 type transport system permease protein